MTVDGISDVWLIELPMALAWRGLVDEAVKVGDALAELDQDNEAMFANDVAAILAEAGRGDEALRRVEQNLHRFPDDLWTQIHAGDVHLALSDRSRHLAKDGRQHAINLLDRFTAAGPPTSTRVDVVDARWKPSTRPIADLASANTP